MLEVQQDKRYRKKDPALLTLGRGHRRRLTMGRLAKSKEVAAYTLVTEKRKQNETRTSRL